MNEPKKKAEPKRKLTLHRETLRSLEVHEPRLLEGVVGGLYRPDEPTMGTHCFACDSMGDCTN